MMSESKSWIETFVGVEVELHYSSQNFKDRGELVHVDENWIEMYTALGEHLLIPTTAIRIIKLIGKKNTPEKTLLRPAKKNADDELDKLRKL